MFINKFQIILIIVVLFFMVSSYSNAINKNEDIYLSLVKNVKNVGDVEVYEGPIKPLNSEWKAIIGGDDDTTITEDQLNTDYCTFTMLARTYGKGRVIAASIYLGEEDIYDNKIMMENISNWLNQGHSKIFAFSTGHGEIRDLGCCTGFYPSQLKKLGYTVRDIENLIYENLKEIDILFIGNAWKNFTNQEITDVEIFVKNGGGLYLHGLGWSWLLCSHDAPEVTMDDYPMVKISQPYQCIWQHGGLIDPTNNIDNNKSIPLYHTFYPNLQNNNTDIVDSDNDGVIDRWDNCPKTPENSCVNNKGCSCELSIIDEKGSVAKNKWKTYYANIDNTYSSFIAKIQNLTEDVDLYVKKGNKPDYNNYDCRPYKGGKRDEVCDLSNNGDTLWYFSIYGYKAGDFNISVKAKR